MRSYSASERRKILGAHVNDLEPGCPIPCMTNQRMTRRFEVTIGRVSFLDRCLLLHGHRGRHRYMPLRDLYAWMRKATSGGFHKRKVRKGRA